jgi:hypothetical protein
MIIVDRSLTEDSAILKPPDDAPISNQQRRANIVGSALLLGAENYPPEVSKSNGAACGAFRTVVKFK